MRSLSILVAAMVISMGASTQSVMAREWTNRADDRTVEADLIAVGKRSITIRRKSDGREFEVSLERLSDADQKFVANLPVWAKIVLDTEFSAKGEVWKSAETVRREAVAFGLGGRNPDDLLSMGNVLDKAGLSVEGFRKRYGEGAVQQSDNGNDKGTTYYVHGPIHLGFKLGAKTFTRLRAPVRLYTTGFVKSAGVAEPERDNKTQTE